MHGLLALIVLVLDVIAIIQIVQSGYDGLKKAIWVVLVFLLPVLGVILWFFLGRKD